MSPIFSAKKVNTELSVVFNFITLFYWS